MNIEQIIKLFYEDCAFEDLLMQDLRMESIKWRPEQWVSAGGHRWKTFSEEDMSASVKLRLQGQDVLQICKYHSKGHSRHLYHY